MSLINGSLSFSYFKIESGKYLPGKSKICFSLSLGKIFCDIFIETISSGTNSYTTLFN